MFSIVCCSPVRTATSVITTSATCFVMPESTSLCPGQRTHRCAVARLAYCPLVCYDLRFPVYSRNRHDGNAMQYDLLLYVANSAARNTLRTHLLRARAIENLSYCVGLNRVGIDGKGLAYSGDSAVLDFLFSGRPMAELGSRNKPLLYRWMPTRFARIGSIFRRGMDADEFGPAADLNPQWFKLLKAAT